MEQRCWPQRTLKDLEQRPRLGAGECSLPYSLSLSSLRDGQVWPNPEVKTPAISSRILFGFVWGRGGGGLVNNGKERLSSIDHSTLPFLLSRTFDKQKAKYQLMFIALLPRKTKTSFQIKTT